MYRSPYQQVSSNNMNLVFDVYLTLNKFLFFTHLNKILWKSKSILYPDATIQRFSTANSRYHTVRHVHIMYMIYWNWSDARQKGEKKTLWILWHSIIPFWELVLERIKILFPFDFFYYAVMLSFAFLEYFLITNLRKRSSSFWKLVIRLLMMLLKLQTLNIFCRFH